MYTVEIYKADKRKKSGERLIVKNDYATDNKSMLEKSVRDHLGKGERYEIHATMVTRTSALTGDPYQERYDTPYYCSASSETYWSN
jgi:hypothetical protein